MTHKAQEKFLRWAKSGDDLWPTIKKGRYSIDLLDLAIREGVGDYLKTEDITPLRIFLETSAELLARPINGEALSAKRTIDGLPPNQDNRSKTFQELCEVYAFAGDFDLAWQTCVRGGLDCKEPNYMTYGVLCPDRKFLANQAYYFPNLRPPITSAGRNHKAEIFPFVDEELAEFQSQKGRNIFDYYYEISQSVISSCLKFVDPGKYKGVCRRYDVVK